MYGTKKIFSYALDFHLPRPWLICAGFYYSLLINICDFNAREIFLLRAAGLGLFYCFFNTTKHDIGSDYSLQMLNKIC
jgi:hypothetical protein